MSATRLFYVTDSVESNEEIFETYQEAIAYFWKLVDDDQEMPRLRICEVNNAYQYGKDIDSMMWNYEDRADTFTTVKEFPIDVAAYKAELLQEKADELRKSLREEGKVV